MAQEAALFYNDAQGITGGNIIAVRAESSTVYEAHHEVHTAVESTTGLSTGRRVHGPMKTLKPIDKATPLLYKALCMNENLPELELRWYRPNPDDGITEHFYSVFLRNVRVSRIEAWLPNAQDPAQQVLSPREWVYFSYGEINWSWIDGGIEHQDDVRDIEV